MKIKLITSYKPGTWDTFAKRGIDSMVANLPHEIDIFLYCEEAKPKDVDKIIAGKELPKLNKKFSDVPTRTTYVLKDTGTLPSGNVEEQLQLSDKEIFEPAKILNQSIRRLNIVPSYSGLKMTSSILLLALRKGFINI